MKKYKNLLRRLLLGASALLLGISIYSWNAKKLMGNQMPMPFGCGISVVLSGSMEPTLSVDDLVVIRQTETVEPGDILVYQSGNSLVIHRLMTADGDTLTLKGDANNTADAPISRDAVKGRLVFAIPKAGALVTLLQQPLVIAVLLGAAVLLMERSFRKEKEKDAQELAQIQQELESLMAELKEKS